MICEEVRLTQTSRPDLLSQAIIVVGEGGFDAQRRRGGFGSESPRRVAFIGQGVTDETAAR